MALRGTVAPGTFGAGGEVPRLGSAAARPIIPLEWLKRHPATRRWWAKAVRATPGNAVDPAIALDDGFEGVALALLLWGDTFADNTLAFGGYRLLLNGVSAFETSWTVGTGSAAGSTSTTGQIDVLPGGSDGDRVWYPIELPIPDSGVLTMQMSGFGAATMAGWNMWGLYWPIGLADEWLARGWRK